MNIWQRKLLAFLHDPPHKALDIKGHEDNLSTFVTQAGFDSVAALQWFEKSADWWAFASDRFPAFNRNLQSPFGGASHPFRHPLGGSELVVPNFPTPELLGEKLQDVQPRHTEIPADATGEKRDCINFFIHWRRWAVEAAQHEWRSAFQPADTRLPDHPIWLHNSVTSALQRCRDEADGRLKPAFLIFQLGPVQDFIAQARSTRDLWSGSYLLSWLMAHAIKAVTDQVGPDAVIFPFLRAQPLFDLLHRDAIYEKIKYGDDSLWKRMKPHENEILVPNLPNKFLALVPADAGAKLAEQAREEARAELQRIAETSWNWINERHPLKSEWRARFNGQIAAFLQITWQCHPWSLDPPTDEDLKELFGCERQDLAYPPNPGLLWARHYAKTDALHAARRNTRDFEPWMKADEHRKGASKDTLSGKEEIVGDEDWWKTLPKTGEFARLFRSQDKLGAINLVKKVWHLAYLRDKKNLKLRGAASFDSVPDIAAGKWLSDFRARSLQALKASPEAFDHVVSVCRLIQEHAEAWNISTPGSVSEHNVDEWLAGVAPEAFLESEWKQGDKEQPEVRAALRKLYADDAVGLGKPPAYVAMLAFDGDEMGKWMSGEKTPPLAEQFSKEARDTFGPQIEGVNRPLSPSYHLQFSEALANFAIYLARPVVEHFGGQLIYAGGDDVLAMVPAAQALDCAEALRAAFQGSKRLAELVPGRFEVMGTNGGFVKLVNPDKGRPEWPLIVPGPRAEASVGIAIGHIHSPLQGLVRAAQSAEKQAKRGPDKGGRGRAAFAVNVYKRSGETMEWGAKWDSDALPLYREFLERAQAGDVSGKFAYALDELIAPYRNTGPLKNAEGFDVKRVVKLELELVLDRQIPKKNKNEKKEISDKLRTLAHAHLEKLDEKHVAERFPLLFRTAAFILRGEHA